MSEPGPAEQDDIGDIAAVVCDLDGVVYRGPDAVPYAVEALRALSVPVLYATNNASRAPAVVAAHLCELGLEANADDIVTSAQAGAAAIAQRVPGGRVLAVGGEGVAIALRERGLEPTQTARDCDAVLQGYGRDVSAADLAEASYAIAAGAWWVATNTDATIPNERGVGPGNGALVAAVQMAVERPPDRVVGKPFPDLYVVAADRLGLAAERILAVGDRLDTDIEGAIRAGMPSALVLTGVDSAAAGRAAPAQRRPSVIIEDLRGLQGLVSMSPGAALR